MVRKWHPDRFTGDPQGIAEATLMLKVVNHAYSAILEHRSAPAFVSEAHSDSFSEAPASRSFEGNLTQTQKDDVVQAIRHSESLLTVELEDPTAGWHSRTASSLLTVAYVAAAWKSGESVSVLAFCLFPLLCIWFPNVVGAHVGLRFTKSSPASLVWFFGWVLLLLPVLAFGMTWWGIP